MPGVNDMTGVYCLMIGNNQSQGFTIVCHNEGLNYSSFTGVS